MKIFPERQFLVYNAEIFFVNSYNPRALVVKRTKLNSKKGVMWDTLIDTFTCPLAKVVSSWKLIHLKL